MDSGKSFLFLLHNKINNYNVIYTTLNGQIKSLVNIFVRMKSQLNIIVSILYKYKQDLQKKLINKLKSINCIHFYTYQNYSYKIILQVSNNDMSI